MNWDRIVLLAKDVIGLVLVARLFSLRLHGVYRVFCGFVLYECLVSSVVLVQPSLDPSSRAYHWEWLALTGGGWVVTLWMVYAILEAVLARLPGILKFSRRFLHYAFLAAVIIALLSAKPELAANAVPVPRDMLDSAVSIGMVLERVIATIVLLVMLAIFCFVLWFPVKMPKNLLVFGVGLVVYFSCRTVLVLTAEFVSVHTANLAAEISMLILAGSFTFWTFSLSRAGESAEVRIGHAWKAGDQQKLVEQLEAINAALLRGGRQQDKSLLKKL